MLAPARIRALNALAAAGVVALAACSSDSAGDSTTDSGDSSTIVVSTFPFGVDELTEAVIEPFEEATGITVEIDTGSNADRLSQLELSGDGSGIDVMLISDYYAAQGQTQELFQDVDADQVPNLAAISDFATEAAYAGPAYSFQLNGTMYRTDEVDEAKAADWALFGDDAFAGRVALPDISVTAGQLTVSGVGDTYGSGPYDVDGAFETLASWAPGALQFYSSTTEVTNLLLQGEIVAAPALQGFATNLVEAGEPIAWTAPASGRYMATNRAMIPAGAPNVDGAHAFIDYLLSAEAQSASAEILGDLPVNPDASVPAILTEVAGDAATDPIGAGYSTVDPEVIVPNRAEWVDRFAREVSSQ
jgi:putative spermidine/putrescine transport system substrate-binding protein